MQCFAPLVVVDIVHYLSARTSSDQSILYHEVEMITFRLAQIPRIAHW